MSANKELAKDALGVFEEAIMGIAGTAPAFSVAVTTAAIVASIFFMVSATIPAATCVIWLLGVLLLFSSSYMPSVKQILESSILAIGFQICFYMILGGRRRAKRAKT